MREAEEGRILELEKKLQEAERVKRQLEQLYVCMYVCMYNVYASTPHSQIEEKSGKEEKQRRAKAHQLDLQEQITQYVHILIHFTHTLD